MYVRERERVRWEMCVRVYGFHTFKETLFSPKSHQLCMSKKRVRLLPECTAYVHLSVHSSDYICGEERVYVWESECVSVCESE